MIIVNNQELSVKITVSFKQPRSQSSVAQFKALYTRNVACFTFGKMAYYQINTVANLAKDPRQCMILVSRSLPTVHTVQKNAFSSKTYNFDVYWINCEFIHMSNFCQIASEDSPRQTFDSALALTRKRGRWLCKIVLISMHLPHQMARTLSAALTSCMLVNCDLFYSIRILVSQSQYVRILKMRKWPVLRIKTWASQPVMRRWAPKISALRRRIKKSIQCTPIDELLTDEEVALLRGKKSYLL